MATCARTDCNAIEQLRGFRVGVTADRRSSEQAELLRRRGGEVLHGPTIHTLTWSDEHAIREATERVIAEPPDVLVANTGIGIRSWVAFAESRGLEGPLLDALGSARIIARGPKAAGAVTQLGLEVERQVPSERLEDLLDDLVAEHVEGRLVALQLSGSDAPWATATLREAGVRVVEVPVYRWTMPDDRGPAERLIDSCIKRRLAAVTFTSVPALVHLFAIAEESGRAARLRQAFNSSVLCACVGPVTAEAALARGIEAPIWPQRGRLGLMIRLLAETLHDQHRHVDTLGRHVVLHGSAVLVDAVQVTLTDRERAVLGLLAQRPGAVVPKPFLLREIWGPDGDPHVVDITIGRLRRRLEPTGLAIRVAPRRGYRLDAG